MTTEAVFETLTNFQKKSDNKCGTTIIQLSNTLNISQQEIKIHLRELYDKKLISVRKGLNNQLIFIANYDSSK
jgi:predicted ArsR family transcriptional regulator